VTFCTCADDIGTVWVDILTGSLISNCGERQHPEASWKQAVNVSNLHNVQRNYFIIKKWFLPITFLA
jgi:hypothetical protein